MKRAIISLGLFLIIGSMVWVLVPSEAEGDAPKLINFQGRLTDGSGNPVADGNYSITFRIYDAATNGNVLWSDSLTVSTNGGLFNTLLGSASALPTTIFEDTTRYLGIRVASDPEMTPRQRLVAVGYSFASNPWGSSGNNVFKLNGNVGIGTASPAAKLDVVGDGIFRRGAGIQDKIVLGAGDPNVGLELRSGTSGGTPFIDFVNDNVSDFDARIRLKSDGVLGIEGSPNPKLEMDGQLLVTRTLTNALGPSEDAVDLTRSYYVYKGVAANPYTYQGSALHARTTIGGGGTNPVGTAHGISSQIDMVESGNSNNEMTPLFLSCVADAPGRLWGVDLNVHGPVSGQADLLQGLVNFANNYNANPIPNKGVGLAVVTKPGGGCCLTPERQAAQTYPLDAGLAIVGFSGTSDEAIKTQGFKTGLQIGGTASGWMQSGTSKMGTGILVRDVETAGIKFQDFVNPTATPALSADVPNVLQVSEGGTTKWQLSQEDAGVNATLLLRDLTETDEWWWGAFAGGDKRLAFQKNRMVVMRSGDVGIGTATPSNILTVVQNSSTDPIADAWTVYSSSEYKEGTRELSAEEYSEALQKLLQTPVVKYRYKGQTEENKEKIGIVIEEAPKEIVSEGNPKAASLNEYISLLHAGLKAQQAEIEKLKETVKELKGKQH